VIGIGVDAASAAGKRLAKIAEDTNGRFFAGVTAASLPSVVNRIDSRLNCDLGLDSFTDVLTGKEPVEDTTTRLVKGTKSLDITVTWDDSADEIVPQVVEIQQNGDRVAVVKAKTLKAALDTDTPKTVGDLKVSGERSKSFFTFRLTGVTGKRVRVISRARTISGKGARLRTQVGQSRRRR
jgi:hypothetical protein